MSSNEQTQIAATGILLLNLGTPDSPQTGSVRRYLRQFLSDPRVIDISSLGRFLLVNLIIAPFRSSKSAEAYRLIWTDEGSPLLFHGQRLTELVQAELDKFSADRFVVKLAMRYGNPSIDSVLREFVSEGIDRIRVLPLYPQYASASVGSTIEEVYRCASGLWNVPVIEILPVFYNHPGYIKSSVLVAKEALGQRKFDHYLFSFHGLPERHILKSKDSSESRCLRDADCCQSISLINRNCYRAQCFATARSIAGQLGLEKSEWSVSFQSRLGRDPWIRPFTDFVFKELPSKGVKSLAIFSPAFVADCLETLEELNIRGRKDFLKAGGEEYLFVPSLNTHPEWVRCVTHMVAPEISR